jgi:hypothetical protein
VFVALWRRWSIAWGLALGAGALLQFILYGGAPAWIGAALPWLYLVFIIRCWLTERSSRMQISVLANETTVG